MNIKIKNGIITCEGEKVGTAMMEMKYGYHPCILIIVNGISKWMEIDESPRLEKIIEFTKTCLEGKTNERKKEEA